MRLAILETQERGGLLHYAVQLGDALAARGNEVDLITPRGNELAARVDHARMRGVLTPRVAGGVIGQHGLSRQLSRGAVAFGLVRQWIRASAEVVRGRYDVVLVNADLLNGPAALGAWAITRLPGRAKVACICHNAQSFSRGQGDDLVEVSRLTRAILRRTFPRFDLVLVHGERTWEDFETVWPPSRLALIPHGDERIFADEPAPPAEGEHILFFGAWRKHKGIAVLVEAFDQLLIRRPAARLTIAGIPFPDDVLDVPAILAWATSHGQRVRVIDRYIPMEEVAALFGEARVVAAPYLAAYQSGVVHLAMTMARAVVATDVGDLSTVVKNGETGFLVVPGNVTALAEALEEVVADPELAVRLGDAGRKRVMSTSSWEQVAARLESLLSGLDPR